MDIKSILNAKAVRFVAVTVLLGAIGSGVWEWILKPIAMGASEFGLNVATLGVQSFKDSLYKDIALGFHEEPSLRVYSAVFGFLPCFVLGMMSGVIAAARSTRASGGREKTTLDKTMGLLAKPMLVLFVLVLIFSVVQANQAAYVNRAVTHFNQLLHIVGPHITVMPHEVV